MSAPNSSVFKEVKRFKKQKFHLKRFLKESLRAFSAIHNDDINKSLLESSGMCVNISPAVEAECKLLAEKDIGVIVLGQSNYAKAVVINEMLKKALIPVDNRRTSQQWRMIKIKPGQKNLTTLCSLDESYDLGDYSSMSSGDLISDALLFQVDQEPEDSPKNESFVCVSLQSEPLLLEGVNIICSPTYKKEYTITEVSQVYSLVTADYIPIMIYACESSKLSEWVSHIRRNSPSILVEGERRAETAGFSSPPTETRILGLDLLELCELRRVAEEQFFCFVLVPSVDRYMDTFFPRLLLATWNNGSINNSTKLSTQHFRAIPQVQVTNWTMGSKHKSRSQQAKPASTVRQAEKPKRRPQQYPYSSSTEQLVELRPEDIALQAQLFRVGFLTKTPALEEENQLLNQQLRLHGWKGVDAIDDAADNKKSNLQMSSILVTDFEQELQKQLAHFIRKRLQNYMLHALSSLYSAITNCLQDFILQAYDISHDLLTTPKRLAFAKSQEAKLFSSLLQQANSRQVEIHEMVASTLSSMKQILPELAARQINLSNAATLTQQFEGCSSGKHNSLQSNSMLALGTESFTGAKTGSSESATNTTSEGSICPPSLFSLSSNASGSAVPDTAQETQHHSSDGSISRKASTATTVPGPEELAKDTSNLLVKASSLGDLPGSTSLSSAIDKTTKECNFKEKGDSTNNGESFSKTTMAIPSEGKISPKHSTKKENEKEDKEPPKSPNKKPVESQSTLNKSRLFGSIQFRKLRLSLRNLTMTTSNEMSGESGQGRRGGNGLDTWCNTCGDSHCTHLSNSQNPSAHDCKVATLAIQNFVLRKLNSVISERVLNCMEILHLACIGTLERTVAGLENINSSDLSKPLFVSNCNEDLHVNEESGARVSDSKVSSRLNAEESIAGAYLATILSESSKRTRIAHCSSNQQTTPSLDKPQEEVTKSQTETGNSLNELQLSEAQAMPNNAMDALKSLLNFTYGLSIPCKRRTSSVMRGLFDNLKEKLVRSFPWQAHTPEAFDEAWKRKVAIDILDSLSEGRIAREVCEQIVERLKMSHDNFVFVRLFIRCTIRRLEARADARSSKFQEAQENIRRQHAPRLARQALEVSSLRYFIAFGIPTLGKEIGRGQYGVVYACSNWGPFVNLAVKSVIPPDDKHWKDLALEIYYSKHIPEHERIVSMYASVIDYSYGMGTTPAVLLIMERLTRDLYTAIRKGLDWIKRLRVALDVAEGIRYLHSQGLIHRDIKPRNVLLDAQDRGKLTDLGFCKPQSMMSGSILGTPMHMAPEIFGKKYDFSVDIYAFGVLFWYICANRMHIPNHFEQCENKEALWHAVRKGVRPERLASFTDDCWDLMRRCWAPDPLARPHPGEIHLILEKIYLEEHKRTRSSQLKALH
ncbi:hypothetical protein Ciccas_009390 [Cichlidogyrus casuarinus]|uniref:Dual serine/threonine and tyrosine protein kinase n=1 Tax=Cichlidogyrus casuarinus TaxID=1844966 RepID=A0ABD2PXV4_9PLAT